MAYEEAPRWEAQRAVREGCIIVVRPDGHVGGMVDGTDVDACMDAIAAYMEPFRPANATDKSRHVGS